MTTYLSQSRSQSQNGFRSRRRPQQTVIPTLPPLSTPECLVFAYNIKAGKFNTDFYTPSLTRGRIGDHELHLFFEQISAPLRIWHNKYKYLFHPPCILALIAFVSVLLAIPGLFFVCWLTWKQNQSEKEHKKAAEEAKALIRELNPSFTERGLIWICPDQSPLWIELITNYQESQPRRENRRVHQGVPVSPQPRVTPVIHTISLPQQNYQNMQTPNQQGYYSPMQQ